MQLESIAAGGASVPVLSIGADKQLARSVQDALARIGLLDPPSDAQFGQVSQWALAEFLKAVGSAHKPVLDAALAEALLAPATEQLFPLHSEPVDLAGRVVAAMLQASHWLCRHPGAANIVYVEGMDVDGRRTANTPNHFDDVRLVLRIRADGRPEIAGRWEATTEPGKHYTGQYRLDPAGAARIAFGQYKSWSVGKHPRVNGHEALVQSADLRIHRDGNQDFRREGDPQFTGMFGINQHWGYDMPRTDIGKASAGCLVGRTKDGHRAFMALCKSDPRYKASQGYRFMATVLAADQLPGEA